MHLIMLYYVFGVICAHDVIENEFIDIGLICNCLALANILIYSTLFCLI